MLKTCESGINVWNRKRSRLVDQELEFGAEVLILNHGLTLDTQKNCKLQIMNSQFFATRLSFTSRIAGFGPRGLGRSECSGFRAEGAARVDPRQPVAEKQGFI